MKLKMRSFCLLLVLGALGAFLSFRAMPEDIDLFSVDEDNNADVPNVLFVIDNSANWARQSQQWPGGLQQGQSEARAIKTVINELRENSVNVGMLEHSTEGSASDTDGGYVRFHIRPMNATNKAAFSAHLDTIFDNINEPVEKRGQGNPFGDLFWDAYNYLSGGAQSKGGAGTPASRADGGGYTSTYSRFRSPLTFVDSCRRTIIIFIGNNVSSGPTADSSANVSALTAAGGVTTQIPFADYTIKTQTVTTPIGYSNACYSSASACTSVENGQACRDGGFDSCACDESDAQDCVKSHFRVVGTNTTGESRVVEDNTVGPTGNTPTGDNPICSLSQKVPESPTCPSEQVATSTSGNRTTTTTTTWTAGSCDYISLGASDLCKNSEERYELRGERTVRTVVSESSMVTTRTDLGETSACFDDLASCTPTGVSCPSSSFNGGCACVAAGSSAGCGASSTKNFQVLGTYTASEATPTGTVRTAPTQGGANFMMDEWARFLRNKGVPLPDSTLRAKVTTYTIDVFNAQQDPNFSALLFNAATAGGGKYYQAKNEDSIVRALREIFAEVQAVNSAFSSASLPVNATNRAQNENQVFIGVFRPDREQFPRWYGNLKRYQLIFNNGVLDLGDVNGTPAINLQTGFIGDCAVSFWTNDSGDYWSNVVRSDVVGTCTTAGTDPNSDLPDGPFVEKGAVSYVLRHGNGSSPDADGYYSVSRTMRSLSGGALVPFTSTSFPSLDPALVRFVRGEDTESEDGPDIDPRGQREPRASIHGDVVHSRPQPVNFGGTRGIVVFYGSNDGTYRAVASDTGRELWSFIAPEHFSKFQRLKDNTPKVRFPGDPLTFLPKDYFFDGSTGLLQTANNSEVIIYPTMRRGGRKLYAFRVKNPAVPEYLWSRGCNSDGSGCDAGFEAIGDTWSLPNVAYIQGYGGGTQPVIIMGGGYDRCEDEDSENPGCGSAKGRGVYVIDALSGALVKHFDFSGIGGARSVPADVALIDVTGDNKVDYAYAVDTGGNIFRMDFIDGPVTETPRDSTAWTSSRVAFTNDSSNRRKFLFPPALIQLANSVYLAIGSGDREHPLQLNYPFPIDGTGGVLNRFYTFRDDLGVTPASEINLDDTSVMNDVSLDPTDPALTGCDAETILPTSTKKGWFFDLNENGPGEQTVTSALIAGGFIVFSTNRPTPDESTACTNSLGEARGYFVNLLNGSGAIGTDQACGGTRSGIFEGGGLPPSPVIATVPVGDKVFTVIIGAVKRSGDPSTIVSPQIIRPPVLSKRRPIYWHKSGDTQ